MSRVVVAGRLADLGDRIELTSGGRPAWFVAVVDGWGYERQPHRQAAKRRLVRQLILGGAR